MPIYKEEFDPHDRPFLLVPVPLQFQRLIEADHELALDWRYKTRDVFVHLFRKGWAVAHIVRKDDEPVLYYVCVKRNELPL